MKRILKNSSHFLLAVIILLIAAPEISVAQPDPGKALWKSLIVPGWGHYYVDKDNWARGKYHLTSDVVLFISWVGFDVRSSRLRDQSFTLANLRAGIDLDGRDRSFRLAVGNFSDLQSYNDHQLRTRNWNRLIEDVPGNRWSWSSEKDRDRYRDLRETSDRIRQQLPAIISLLVVNRVVSGLSAFIRARNRADLPDARIEPTGGIGQKGFVATLSFRF